MECGECVRNRWPIQSRSPTAELNGCNCFVSIKNLLILFGNKNESETFSKTKPAAMESETRAHNIKQSECGWMKPQGV